MSLPTEQKLSLVERHGLIATVVVGFLSTVMPSSLLLYVLYRVVAMRRAAKPLYPITLFYMSLLFWSTMQGVGWIVGIPWIRDGRIVMGEHCVAQAIIKQLGTTGTTCSIIGMSWCIFHDYVVDFPENLSLRHGYVGLGAIFLIQGLNLAIPNAVLHGAYHYYGISGYWCWIANDHYTTKIVTHYLWYWTAGLFSFLTAVAYFFSARYERRLPAGFFWIGFPMEGNRLFRLGLFSVSLTSHDNRNPDWSWSTEIRTPTRTFTIMFPIPFQYFGQDKLHPAVLHIDKGHKEFAARLIWFPISYIALIAPQSIIRFLQFSGREISLTATFAGATVIGLTGVVDVALFILAKPAFGIDFSDEKLELQSSHTH